MLEEQRDRRVSFFGAQIDALTMTETIAKVESIISSRNITQHVVINVAKLVLMQEDLKLREIVNSCGLINADGQGIVWGARMLGIAIPERVTGIDLFLNIVKVSAEKGYRLYFFGATQAVIENVIRKFKALYPGLVIAGYRNGYYEESEEGSIADEIRNSKPDVLFVAMGSPKKEFFLNKHLKTMNVPFVMGVGGSFDVVAGYVKRAPVWMRHSGLEWFYRLLSEPARMWKRYLVSNTVFLGMLIKAIFLKSCGVRHEG